MIEGLKNIKAGCAYCSRQWCGHYGCGTYVMYSLTHSICCCWVSGLRLLCIWGHISLCFPTDCMKHRQNFSEIAVCFRKNMSKRRWTSIQGSCCLKVSPEQLYHAYLYLVFNFLFLLSFLTFLSSPDLQGKSQSDCGKTVFQSGYSTEW